MGDGYGRVVGVDALVEPLDGAGWRCAGSAAARWEFDDAGLPVRADAGPGTEVRLRHDDRRGSSSSAHAAAGA